MSDNVVMFSAKDDPTQFKIVVECRGCGRLLAAYGQFEQIADGDGALALFVTSSGTPIFGECPSNIEHPWCRDKMSVRVLAAELPERLAKSVHHSPQNPFLVLGKEELEKLSDGHILD